MNWIITKTKNMKTRHKFLKRKLCNYPSIHVLSCLLNSFYFLASDQSQSFTVVSLFASWFRYQLTLNLTFICFFFCHVGNERELVMLRWKYIPVCMVHDRTDCRLSLVWIRGGNLVTKIHNWTYCPGAPVVLVLIRGGNRITVSPRSITRCP